MRTSDLRNPFLRLVVAAVALSYASPVAAQDLMLPSLGKKKKPAEPAPEGDDFALPALKPKGDKKPGDDLTLPGLKPRPAEPVVEARPVVDRAVARGPLFPLSASQTAKILVKLFDANSQPVGASLTLTANQGTVTAPVETAPGTFQATYAAPDELPATGGATVKIEVRNQPKPVIAQVNITFTSPEPVAMVAPPPPPPVAINPPIEKPAPTPATEPKKLGKPARIVFAEPVQVRPGQLAKISFTVEDEDGNKLPLEGVEVKSHFGTLSNLREVKGSYLADFQPSPKDRGNLNLYAEAGGEALLGEGTVTVRKPGLRPEDKRIGIDVALFAGGLTNFGKVASPSFELGAEYHVQPKIRAGLLVGLSPANASDVQEQAGGVRTANVSMSIIPIFLRAAYVQELGPVDVYGGGMAGLALISGKVTSATEQSFSDQSFGLAGFAGAGLPLGPGTLQLELRLSRTRLDYQSPDSTLHVTGGLGGLSGALGYKIEL